MADVFTIDDLNALTTLTAADEVPVWDSEESGEPTKKITASNLAASVKSLASLPNTTEMNTAIEQSTAYTTGSVTPVGSGSSAQFIVVKQFGKVVSLYGAITGVTVGSNIKIGTISGVSAPATTVRTLCGVAVNAYDHPQDVAYLSIYTTGEIYVTSTQTGTKAVYFAVTYIA